MISLLEPKEETKSPQKWKSLVEQNWDSKTSAKDLSNKY